MANAYAISVCHLTKVESIAMIKQLQLNKNRVSLLPEHQNKHDPTHIPAAIVPFISPT